MSRKIIAKGYLVLVPDIRGSYVYGVRIDRYRKSKPDLMSGEIAIQIKLNFDEEHVLSAIPVVEADVTAFAVSNPQVEIGTA